MITVALIDDHLIVRSGFAQLLGLEPDLQVVAEFGSGREALAGLPGRGVQVCICDISMPDISGLELLSQLPKGMATIMLSVHDSPALVEQALNAGARGFLSKRCSPDELIAAVHTVATGGCYLTPDIAIKLASGLVLATVCYQPLAPVGIAGRTVALYAILSGAADYRAGLALWLARSADCDIDERHRADRQSNLARSSGGFIALAAGAKSDRVVTGRRHPAVA